MCDTPARWLSKGGLEVLSGGAFDTERDGAFFSAVSSRATKLSWSL